MHIERGRIFDSSLRKSVPLGSTRLTTTEKSAELAAEVEAFLAAGGKITQVESLKPVQRPPHKSSLTLHNSASASANDDMYLRTKGASAIPWPDAMRTKDKLDVSGITVKELALRAGVEREALLCWIRTGKVPSRAVKLRIDEALDGLLTERCRRSVHHG